MAMNLANAQQVLRWCLAHGVQEFCVGAGARNAPLVIALSEAQSLTTRHFFDERSAAFFAVGRMARDRRPVAVITTSGTAAAELLPAVIESFYLNLPLLVISADRPPSYRGTGAPQAIEQVGLFQNYVEFCADLTEARLPVEEPKSLKNWTHSRPAHLNICFDEPLLEGDRKWQAPKVGEPPVARFSQFFDSTSVPLISPVVIASGKTIMSSQATEVVAWLRDLQLPIYAEGLSELSGQPELQPWLLRGGEKTLQKLFQKGLAKSVVRLGGVPTLRFWRDLEDLYRSLPVAVLSDSPFSGLARGVQLHWPIEKMAQLSVQGWSTADTQAWQEIDQNLAQSKNDLLLKHKTSEQSLLWVLSQQIKDARVYLGNSLPIREWDLVAPTHLPFESLFGNRGANGIDGQISSFLGWASGGKDNWAIIGDLTALYDLSALWIDRHLAKGRYRIVIINNGGGQIFQNMFHNENFLNRHQLQFQKWAEMWGWDYRQWNSVPSHLTDLPERVVIELRPNEISSQSFWEDWKKL